MTLSRRHFTLGALATGASTALTGCVNVEIPFIKADDPAPEPVGRLAPPAADVAVGDRAREGLLEAFGGAYSDARLQRYVGEVGARVAAGTEAEYPYRFTVLDSTIVNAFALPNGHVFVTRGLLALAANEAELAGILALQLGHVNARHAIERYSGPGATSGSRRPALFRDVPAEALDTGSGGALSPAGRALRPHSAGEVLTADALGVKYLARAGYAPSAMASLLGALRTHSILEARSLGLPIGSVPTHHAMSTHPRQVGQVQAAVGKVSADGATTLNAGPYLASLNGLRFGGDQAQGYAQGRRFVHPGLGYQFDAPPGFSLRNHRGGVFGTDGKGHSVLLDVNDIEGAANVRDYLTNVWGRGARLSKIARTKVNGSSAVTAASFTRDGAGRPVEVRLVVVRRDAGSVWRLMFLSPPSDNYDWEILTVRSTYSLKPLSAAEGAATGPLVIRTGTAGGRPVSELSGALPYGDGNDAWFRVYNRIAPEGQPAADQVLKLFGA